MKLIPITLTLPGIAGLILTIGVAADSNVVIFERIKEEARKGHSMISAITTGYRKGIATIVDANVITLLTAFILFGLATAGVKGFAFTLGVGTIVSLLTAVVFTRAVLGLMGRSPILRSPRFLGAGEERVRWHFDFAGASKWFFSISGAILMIGALSFATKQLDFGIDFESGSKLDVALAEDALASTRSASRSAPRASRTPTRAKIQEAENAEFGENVFQISAELEPDQVGVVQEQLDQDFGYEQSAEESFQSQVVGPTFGEQVARSAGYAIAFSLLLIAAYVAFRFEAKYAIPVMIAVDPRRPDHRRRVLAGRPGGERRNRRRVPDDPRLLALRHRDRLRPDPRERAAPAARDLRPDRQPLARRGPHAVADHRPLDGLPDRA